MTSSAFHDECEFVRWLSRRAPRHPRGVVLGIGDDAALVSASPKTDWILTTDFSIEGVHFISSMHPPEAVGHRALARSLSDVAAMGGVPRFALISLALARGVSRRWVKSFYMAIYHLADRYGVAVLGGDTAIVPARTTVDVVLIGEVPKGKALLRSGAKAGDQIFVSGRLGCSALGLRLLREGARPQTAWAKAALQAHLRPEPRCALGQFLATRGLASALIDISDGLSTDLARLCGASKVGARISEASLPIPVIGQPRPAALEPLQLALHDGEDYELLFTVPPGKLRQIPKQFRGVSLHCIGVVESSKRIYLVRPSGDAKILKPSGFDHFQRSTG